MSSYCKWTRTVRTNAYIISRREIERIEDSRDDLESLSLRVNHPSTEWVDFGDCAEFAFDRSLKPVTRCWKSKRKCRQYLRHSKVGCKKRDLAFIRAKKGYDFPELYDGADYWEEYSPAMPHQDTTIEGTSE